MEMNAQSSIENGKNIQHRAQCMPEKHNFSGHQKPNMTCFSLKKYTANAENIATRIAINIHNSLKLPVFPFSATCLLGIALVPPSIMVPEGLSAVLRRDIF